MADHFMVTSGASDAVVVTFGTPLTDLSVSVDIRHTDPGGLSVEASDRSWVIGYYSPDVTQPAWDPVVWPTYPHANPANTYFFDVRNVFESQWCFENSHMFTIDNPSIFYGSPHWERCAWQNVAIQVLDQQRTTTTGGETYEVWQFDGQVDGVEWASGGGHPRTKRMLLGHGVDVPGINVLVIGMMGSNLHPGEDDNGTRFDNLKIGTAANPTAYWDDNFESANPLAAYDFITGDVHISTWEGCVPLPVEAGLHVRQKTPRKPGADVTPSVVSGGDGTGTIYIKFVGGENHFYTDCACTNEISVPFGAYDGFVRGCGDCA